MSKKSKQFRHPLGLFELVILANIGIIQIFLRIMLATIGLKPETEVVKPEVGGILPDVL
jgi:hypothetical protein